MIKFLLMILASSIGQILTIIIVHGFIQSYFGRNSKEEISRFFDKFSKHIQKQKKPKTEDKNNEMAAKYDHY